MSNESEKLQYHNRVKKSWKVENIHDKITGTFSSSVDLLDSELVKKVGTIPKKDKKCAQNSQNGSKHVVQDKTHLELQQ